MIKISIYKSLLRNDNGTVFKSNNHYPLTKDVFRLYYTSLSAKPCTTQGVVGRLPPFERAVVVATSCWATAKKYFEGMHSWKNYPYVGYGHQPQPGEHFTADMTEHQADCIQRDVQCQPTRTHIAFLLWRKKSLLIPYSWIYYCVVQGKAILHQSSAKQACPVIRLSS